jgi:hypothetical protein
MKISDRELSANSPGVASILRANRLREKEGPARIDAEIEVEALDADVQQVASRLSRNAGVVDQAIHAAKCGEDRVDEAWGIIPVSQIGGYEG